MFIRLNGITLFAHHGVYEEEIRKGNHFEIDLEVEIQDSAKIVDEISDVLDYSKLYAEVVATSQSRRYNLLEAFASDICTKILDSFAETLYIRVKVRKMNPPIGGEVKAVEVEFQKRRKNA